MITILVNGVETYVSNTSDVDFKQLGFIDLSQEAQRWNHDDVFNIRKQFQEQQLQLFANPNKKQVHDAWILSKDNAPKTGTLKSIEHDVEFNAWLSKHKHLTDERTIDDFVQRVNVVRKCSRSMYVKLLCILFTSDPAELFRSLFPFDTIVQAAHEVGNGFYAFNDVLYPIFDIYDNVNGRGEILTTFLFRDAKWNAGTCYFDISCKDGTFWHVKEFSSSIRLGKAAYTTSKLCKKIIDVSQSQSWCPIGKCDVRNSITKGLVEANKALLDEHFEGDFSSALQQAMLTSESDATGVVFFKNQKCYPRFMRDCMCSDVSKGDFRISPRVL